ncbi:MAG TPA: shikimate dehydrogenase [Bacilli bacterium]|nr:shikimate dehydrogenase [Bacilli bacterium]
MITSTTQLTGLFGHPVAHSKSPQMHNAAFAHLGLDYAYLAFDVAPEAIGQAVASIRALNLRGVNVTIPHKVAVIPYLDELSEAARLIGAVNTIVHESGKLVGHNTDGIGYLTALREETGFDVRGKKVLLLGAGGACRAVAVQMALEGAALVAIAARDTQKASDLAQHIAKQTAAKTKVLSFLQQDEQEAVDTKPQTTVADFDLIVNTTPVGMHPHTDAVPLYPAFLQKGQLVSDLIYNPRLTRFLQEAQARGCRISGGLGMFVHQGAHAFELWTGIAAPTDVMRAKVESCL